MLNVGRLRDRIRIMRQNPTTSGGIVSTVGFQEVYSSWGDVGMLSGRQLIASASQKFESTMRVYIRYNPDITADDVVAWKPLRATKERQLTIDAVIHNEAAMRTELLCTEGVKNYTEINQPNPGNPNPNKPTTGKDWGSITTIPVGLAVGDWGTIKATAEYWMLGDAGMFYVFGKSTTDYIDTTTGTIIKPPFPANEVRGVDVNGIRLADNLSEAAIPTDARLTLVNGTIATKQADGAYLDQHGKAVLYPSGDEVPDVIKPQTKPTQGKNWGVLTSIPFNDRPATGMDFMNWKRDIRAIKVYDYGLLPDGDYWQLGEFGEFLRFHDGQQTKQRVNPVTGANEKYPRPNAGGFDVSGVSAVDELGYRVADDFDPDTLPIGARGTAVNGVHFVKVSDDEFVNADKPSQLVSGISGANESGRPSAGIPNLPPVVPRNEDGTTGKTTLPHPATGKDWGFTTEYPTGAATGDYGTTQDQKRCWVALRSGMFYDYSQTDTDFIDPVTGADLFRPYAANVIRATDQGGIILSNKMKEADIPVGARVTMQNGRMTVKQADGSYLFEAWQNKLRFPDGSNDYERGLESAWPKTGTNWGIHWSNTTLETGRRGIHVGDFGVSLNGTIWVLNSWGLFNRINTNMVIEPGNGTELKDPFPPYDASMKTCVRGVSAPDSKGWLIDPLIDEAGLRALPDGARGTMSDGRQWKKQGGSFVYADFGSPISDLSVIGEL